MFIRQDKGVVDLRQTKVRIDLRQSEEKVELRQSDDESSEYYDDYYDYEDEAQMVCCNQENYIKPVDDCSDQEDHV